MKSALWFCLAALGEIAGCYAFWGWQRLKWPGWVIAPGVVALVIFAWALTRVDTAHAGRAYAAYAAVYLTGALIWLRVVEGVIPDRWDLLGGGIALLGCAVILFGPRAAG
jgi:small multidrug resistance family-3 protein